MDESERVKELLTAKDIDDWPTREQVSPDNITRALPSYAVWLRIVQAVSRKKAGLVKYQGERSWVFTKEFFFQCCRSYLGPDPVGGCAEDGSHIKHVMCLFYYVGSGAQVCAAVSSKGKNRNILYGVNPENPVPDEVVKGLLAQSEAEVGVHPEVLRRVMSGASLDLLETVAAEGQMLRCFALAETPMQKFAFFEMWFCVVSRLMSRKELREQLFPSYKRTCDALNAASCAGSHTLDGDGLGVVARDELHMLPRVMDTVRKRIPLKLYRAVCPSLSWNVYQHKGPILEECVVQHGKYGVCMHSDHKIGKRLTLDYEEKVGKRSHWHTSLFGERRAGEDGVEVVCAHKFGPSLS